MKKFLLVLSLLMACVCFAVADNFTLTTYYPAPNGNYQDLSARNVAISSTITADTLKLTGLTKSLIFADGGTNRLTFTSGALWNGMDGITVRRAADPGNLHPVFEIGSWNESATSRMGYVAIGTTAENGWCWPNEHSTLRVNGGVYAKNITVRAAAGNTTSYSTMDPVGSGFHGLTIAQAAVGLSYFIDSDGNSMRLGQGDDSSSMKSAIITIRESGWAGAAGIGLGTALPDPNLSLEVGQNYQRRSAYFHGHVGVNVGISTTIALSVGGQVSLGTTTVNGRLLTTEETTVNGAFVGLGTAMITGNVGIGGNLTLPVGTLSVGAGDAIVSGTVTANIVNGGGVKVGLDPNSVTLDYNNNPGGIGAPALVLNRNLYIGAFSAYAAAFLHTSDERLKQDITPLTGALDKVKAMNGVYFKFKADPTRTHVGLIAQNVEKAVPEVVSGSGDGMKYVEYANLVAVLIEAIKEQQVVIDGLRNDVAELKAQQPAKQ